MYAIVIILICVVVAVMAHWPEKKQFVKREKRQNTQDVIAGWKRW